MKRRIRDQHIITSIHFGEGRRVACGCGARLKGFATDDDMAEGFQQHRVKHGARRRALSDTMPYGDGIAWSERFAWKDNAA